MRGRRAADLGGSFEFDHYKIVSFCNLTLADQVLRVEPGVGVLMPCRLVVFARKGSPDVVVVGLRPTFLSKIFKSPEMQRIAEIVEGDMVQILRMVAPE